MVTDNQVRRLRMLVKKERTIRIAALKTAMSVNFVRNAYLFRFEFLTLSSKI